MNTSPNNTPYSQQMHKPFTFALLTGCLLFSGCATTGTAGNKKDDEGFKFSNLAKSDVSYMADIAMQQMEDMLRDMMIKLYKRNPRELRKGAESDMQVRLDAVFSRRGRLIFDEIQGKEEIRAMLLGLEPDYTGDRVFALMVGLTGMVRRSYSYREEFFILQNLNGQSLYNAARNIETLAWRLRVRRNENDDPLLLTNSRPGEPENLSFERQFGKMIALQDFMAELASTNNNRTITKVVQSVGSMVFLPVP